MGKHNRTIAVHGKRVSIQLTQEEWDFIDFISDLSGEKWTRWASPVLEGLPEGENMTAALRLEAFRLSKVEMVGGLDRAQDLAAADRNKHTKNHGMLNDAQLEEILSTSEIQGESDFGGFTIIFGIDELGREFLAVKNNLLNHPHFMTV